MSEIKIFKNMTISVVDPRLYSSFIEQMGRAIYTGIYEPNHPHANVDGFRNDVLEYVKDLNLEYIRYPGGNFVSGYNWKDGIGDVSKRPQRLDLAWKSIETNEIGLDEFFKWTQQAETQIMGAVNLGTGNIRDAAEIIEYSNHKCGTTLSEERIKNGNKEPYNINLWCLGNEMDGAWQIGQLDAKEYGRKAREAAKMMKLVDPEIETVLVGSSSPLQPSFPMWDRVALEESFDYVDYISLHRYYWNEGNDQDFVACYKDFDEFIKTMYSTVNYVKAVKRSNKDIHLSIDEWNIWYLNDVKLKDWEHAPRILEDNYSFLDALAFSGMLITILNNCDKVKIACLAQLVNVIAPIVTVPNGIAFKQTVYYPFYLFSKFGRGTVLNTYNNSTKIRTKYDETTETLISTTVYDKDKGEINLFILNLDLSNSQVINIKFYDFKNIEFIEQYILFEDDLTKKNTAANPKNVIPKVQFNLETRLKPGTFTVIRYKENNV